MQIKVLSRFAIGDFWHIEGEIVEVDDSNAALLIGSKHAEAVGPESKPKAKANKKAKGPKEDKSLG